jgi:hypothetical protein
VNIINSLTDTGGFIRLKELLSSESEVPKGLTVKEFLLLFELEAPKGDLVSPQIVVCSAD